MKTQRISVKSIQGKNNNTRKVVDLVNALNKEVSQLIKDSKSPKRQTMMALKGESVIIDIFDFKWPDERVWVRGDGSRYKEPGYIRFSDKSIKVYSKQHATFKRLFPNKQALIDYAWEALKSVPRSKDLGTVSGEFGGSEYAPALRAGGMLWIKRGWGIEYGSPSRLNNGWVWRQRAPKVKDEVS